jgi:energy-coupling factor transport system permease protein
MTARGLHHAEPAANAVLLFCLVGAALAARSVAVPFAEVATIVLLAVASGERPDQLVPLRTFVFLFAFVLFLAQVLSVPGGAVLVASPLRITVDGVLSGARMSLRFLVILTSSALFVRTTDPDRLAGALVRLRVPYRYAYLVILALRFVPFFQGELRAVRDAQRVRGIKLSVRGPRKILRSVRYTFVPVLVSGLHRVDAIAISMKGRCFGLSPTRTTSSRTARSGWSLAALSVGLAVVGWAVAAGFLGWRG